MTAIELFHYVSALNVSLSIEGDKLRVNDPDEAIDTALENQLAEHKPALMALLAASSVKREIPALAPSLRVAPASSVLLAQKKAARDFPFPRERFYVCTLTGLVGYRTHNDHGGRCGVRDLLDGRESLWSRSWLQSLTWEEARSWWLAQPREGRKLPVTTPAPALASAHTANIEKQPPDRTTEQATPSQPRVTVTQTGTFLSVVTELADTYRRAPGKVALDLETTGLSARHHKVVSLALGVPDRVSILDLRPYYELSEAEQAQWQKAICALIGTQGVIWIGQNLKFDWQFLREHFGAILEKVYDIMLVEQVLHGMKQSQGRAGFSLRDLAARYDLPVSKEERNWFVGLDTRPEEWDAPFPEKQLRYIVQDIEIPYRIAQRQQPQLSQHHLQGIANLENSCVPALASLESHGVLIDREHWRQALRRKELKRADLEKELVSIFDQALSAARAQQQAEEKRLMRVYTSDNHARSAYSWTAFRAQGLQAWAKEHPGSHKLPTPGQSINLGSPVQVKTALAQLGIHVTSTEEETLEEYASNPLIAQFLAWRKLKHFCDAFGENLLALVEDDGRIHAHFAQVGAVSGRIICSKPNLQQIPKKREQGSGEEDIRCCFIAPSGSVLLTSDLSNIELRILAEVSHDETMLRLFAEGRDLHAETAKLMFRLPPETDTKRHLYQGASVREIAKQINYGLSYGMSAYGLASRVNVSVEEARKLMDTYARTYPGATRWLRQTAQRIQQQGFIASLAGRKRFFSFAGANQGERSSIERMARNHPIQATNADILKRAIAILYDTLPAGAQIVLVVHDEIVIECPKALAEEAERLLKAALIEACRADLQVVHIPEPEVLQAPYWQKG